MELLLLADPSLEKVQGYLGLSRCFVASHEGTAVGAYVVQDRAHGTYELMSIAVAPSHQHQGIGTLLLEHAVAWVRQSGARRLEVGTGTFGYQLSFYQRQGFRVVAIDRDFFLDHYPEPLFEDGIQHKDMLRLALDYRS
ncbi:N-acetyltransferase [Lysobacter psychrotolerans]|uniref:N-acetyltransferase n=1 Tax=Montanilutibacter psychrotolerans TaxID=1327343 RepID=A0A3M8T7D1_9GAMM|nr:N-acetyltransferase [Lysobacter psychrotolerans]